MKTLNHKIVQKITLTFFAVFNIVGCGPEFRLIDEDSQNLVQYSKNLALDVVSVKKRETPKNDTLLRTLEGEKEPETTTSSDSSSAKAQQGDVCGTIKGLIGSSNGNVTDEEILSFHKCKISVILEMLRDLANQKTSTEQATPIEAQIDHHEALLEKIDSDKSTQIALIDGTRKLIEDITEGKLAQRLEEAKKRDQDAPKLTLKQQCEILKKTLDGDIKVYLPEDARPQLQEHYDSKCRNE
jgi:hypothetical protein